MTSHHERMAHAYRSYDEEYDELCDTWRALDQKSQGALQTAGVMVALLVGFTSKAFEPLNANGWLHNLTLLLSATAFLLLSFCITFAVLSLRIRRVTHPPKGTGWNDLEAFIGSDPLGQNTELEIHGRRLLYWRQTNLDVWRINESKAAYLVWSQVLLAAATAAVTVAVVIFLISLWRT
jgi:hypothetical protein